MGEQPAEAAPAHFRAFISYSHADAGFARWLHRKLEAWRLPDKSRLAPIFIDRAELAAGADLTAQVRDALSASAALVVVASPNARASRWVGQEIALFRELHPDRPILATLAQGEPGEAFPEALTRIGGSAIEPLGADFRPGHDGKRLGLLKIAAGLTGGGAGKPNGGGRSGNAVSRAAAQRSRRGSSSHRGRLPRPASSDRN